MQDKDSRSISKADITLFVIVILACVIACVCIRFFGKTGYSVSVMIDGKEVASYSLDKDTEFNPFEDIYAGQEGLDDSAVSKEYSNIVCIENGQLTVREANCPDKICANHAAIKNVGETIICLPHKLVVEITE